MKDEDHHFWNLTTGIRSGNISYSVEFEFELNLFIFYSLFFFPIWDLFVIGTILKPDSLNPEKTKKRSYTITGVYNYPMIRFYEWRIYNNS
ncbi:hypothetical protein HZS_6797 [Henneguya salminicola]|nr:hypothetical protein HZS_6797 [Henneguya salminicola]